jgi:biopolymer transport protein ExbB
VLVKGRQRWVTSRGDRRFFGALARPLRLSSLKVGDRPGSSAARLARAGLAALAEQERSGDELDAAASRETLEIALQAQIESERRAAESGLAVLASIGSTAPFVGLFGTVWGIIHALRAIGRSGSASLEVVAAPIGEALVATAIGIAVAVPAVLAYNFFLRRLKVQSAELGQFAGAFLAALPHHDRLPAAGVVVDSDSAVRRRRGEAGTVQGAAVSPREASV